jgi:hypothetical protein
MKKLPSVIENTAVTNSEKIKEKQSRSINKKISDALKGNNMNKLLNLFQFSMRQQEGSILSRRYPLW